MPWTPPPDNPQGIILYGNYRVGRKLGEGAQAVVHAVVDVRTGAETENVVKLAKTANPTLSKRKYQEMNRDALMLNGECQRYKSSFNMGVIVPKIPNMFPDGPKVFQGESNGWSYMIIEKMDKPLWDCIDELIDGSGNAKDIDLSPLAQKLIQLVKAVHNAKHIIVDVKPDNLMFATTSKKSETLADLLRLVDLGLFQPLNRPQYERVNELTGNALYCSLHMQEMNTPTLRDDIQMMVLVIAEMAIRVNAKLHGETYKYENTPTPSYLPWSQEQSEARVFRCKQNNLLDHQSEFYQRMPSKCATTIFRLVDMAQQVESNVIPPYQDILAELKSFTVPKPAKRKARSTPKKSTAVARSTRTTTPARASTAAAATSPARSTRAARTPTTRGDMRGARKTRSGIVFGQEPTRYESEESDSEEDEDAKPSPRKRPARRNSDMVIDLVESENEDDSVEPMEIDTVVGEEQENLGNRRPKQSLLVTVKRRNTVLHSFTAYPNETFVFGTSDANNFKKKTRVTIPAGEENHCSVKVAGVPLKRGQTEYDKILRVEVEHIASSGVTKVGIDSLKPSNKKNVVVIQKILKGRVGSDGKITIGDVHITLEKLY